MRILRFRSPWSSLARRVAAALACALPLLALLGFDRTASAFCGFYVTGATSNLYANATMVVLMREGTRTVLSMQNNYQGPPSDFALVIPVPVVLTQDQVKTLPHDVFQHVDALGAPRLVEYWEQNPCVNPYPLEVPGTAAGAKGGGTADAGAAGQVVVNARFSVGEYNIVILSANDSTALATWLTQNQYNIPSGAAAALQPYVAKGTKFFVAKVDPTKVTFQNGQAALSPLRFYYDGNDFSLPIRLGLLNSAGQQDLIVSILSPNQRYEVANYTNITIPTNIRVQNSVRDEFATFYESLFRAATSGKSRTVVTEYSWDSGSCDPCPTPPLTNDDLATFGADVTRNLQPDAGYSYGYLSYTLTRLHYRYSPGDLGDDLVFQPAPPITGGRGIPDSMGNMDETVSLYDGGVGYASNNFQGRYVILHPWTGSLACDASLQRGIWGGPPPGYDGGSASQGLANTALTGTPPAAGDLSAMVAENVPSIGVTAKEPLDPLAPPPQGKGGGSGGSAGGGSWGCVATAGAAPDGWAAVTAIVGCLGVALFRRPRRGSSRLRPLRGSSRLRPLRGSSRLRPLRGRRDSSSDR
jgi:hypothetical protein